MDLGLGARACIITGASGGIGGVVARTLAAEGAAVLLAGRRQEALAENARICIEQAENAGRTPRVRTLALDLRRPAAAAELVTACLEGFGSVDVVVNSAGTSGPSIAADRLTDVDWQDQWEIHVMAGMRLMRAAAPLMAQKGWGRIVNVSSSSGKRSSSRNAAYSVAKSAQLALSRAYADLYAARGVLINAVAPGPVAGELWHAPGGLADQRATSKGQTRQQVLDAVASRIPTGRYSSEQEIADVIVFLCSERASNVSGAAWSADGGAVPVII